MIAPGRMGAAALAAALALVLLPTEASALIPPDTDCRSGKVALTFDDGPHRTNTPRLLKVLRRQRAQVTFYVQGRNAQRYPRLLRTMVKDGHAVENHSWDHSRLTLLSDAAVRSQLTRTNAAIRKATGRTPQFVRPPYGATDGRIRAIAHREGLSQQLWTVDTRDWTGLSPGAIAGHALKGLRKHRHNVILMHDAVTNSPRTIEAVPAIVKGVRHRGFCLVPQQSMMALQKVGVRAARVPEPSGSASSVQEVVLRLDSPAQRPGRVLVTAVDGTARAGTHYRRSPIWVRFDRGDTEAVLRVRIFRVEDATDRTFSVRLSRPSGLQLRASGRRATVTIVDNGVHVPSP